MRLGLYIFASLTLTAIIGAFVYTINPNHYIVDIMGVNLNLPVAVWAIVPMVFLLVFTIIHMSYYGMKGYFKLKKWQRDASTLNDALYWSLLHEPKEQKYAIEEIASSAVLLKKSAVEAKDNVEGLSPRLAKVVNIIHKINNGEYVDLREHKLRNVLSEGNPILIRNRLNRLHNDEKFVEEVMQSSNDTFSKEVQAEALAIFAKRENFTKAKKYIERFDAKNFIVMLKRLEEEEELELTTDVLDSFVEEVKLGCRDFVEIANITKKVFSPVENLSRFKHYQQENPKAQNAYLYLLFEYELLDEVSAYLEEHEHGDFIKFRALYDLKRENMSYNLNDLVDTNSIC